jgi:FtsZ-interacting cell division protein ZipA
VKTLLERLADKIARQRTPEGKTRSWWRWIIIGAVIIIGIIAALWILGRERRELAKLRHEKYVRQQEAAQARVDAQLAEAAEVAQAALRRAEAAEERIMVLDAKLLEAERVHDINEAAVDRLRWSDLPRHG